MTSSPSHGIFSWISGQNWPWFFSTHLAVTHPECWKTLRATPNNLSISMCEVMPLCCCSCCLGMPCRATVTETWGFGRYVEPVAQLRPSKKRVHGHCGHCGHCGHYVSDAQIGQAAMRPSLWDVFPMISNVLWLGWWDVKAVKVYVGVFVT